MLPPLLIMDVRDVGNGSPMKNGCDGSKRSTVTNTITRIAIFEVVTHLSRSSAESTDLSMLYLRVIAVERVTGGALVVVD